MIGKKAPLLIAILVLAASGARAICPYDANCLNNPFTGRKATAPQGGVAVAPFGTYSNNQLNPEFGGDPLSNGGFSNPYAPPPKTPLESGTSAAAPFGGMSGSHGSLQGFDPDRR